MSHPMTQAANLRPLLGGDVRASLARGVNG